MSSTCQKFQIVLDVLTNAKGKAITIDTIWKAMEPIEQGQFKNKAELLTILKDLVAKNQVEIQETDSNISRYLMPAILTDTSDQLAKENGISCAQLPSNVQVALINLIKALLENVEPPVKIKNKQAKISKLSIVSSIINEETQATFQEIIADLEQLEEADS